MLVLHAALALECVDEVAHGVVFDAGAASDFVQIRLVNEVGVEYIHARVIRVRYVAQARVVSASWLSRLLPPSCELWWPELRTSIAFPEMEHLNLRNLEFFSHFWLLWQSILDLLIIIRCFQHMFRKILFCSRRVGLVDSFEI